MKIRFNGNFLDVESTKLIDFLISHELDKKTGIAVAINREIVTKSRWTEQTLEEKDEVLIITAAAGG
jgi:sulfur carrier protein